MGITQRISEAWQSEVVVLIKGLSSCLQKTDWCGAGQLPRLACCPMETEAWGAWEAFRVPSAAKVTHFTVRRSVLHVGDTL
jgi:hypothetical protein